MVVAALGYLYGGAADAGWAAIIAVVSPYVLFYIVALIGALVGAEPAPAQRRRRAM